MTQQVIQLGTAVNSGTGDPLSTAFGKANGNFNELYGRTQFSIVLSTIDATGGSDVTVAIQAAINAAQSANGGTVILPVGTFLIGTAGTGLVISANNIRLIGQGDQYILNSGVANPPGTTLKWGGGTAAGASMVALTSPSGATNNPITGCAVSGMLLDCQSKCGYGISLTSVKKSNISQIYSLNPISAAFYLTTLLNANLQQTDTQHNIFTQCIYDCIATAASKKAHGFWLTNAAPSSSTNGNTSFNTFIECLGQNDGTLANNSGICFKLDAADNNSFINCIGYRASGTTVPSVQLNGNNPSSDCNIFYHYSDTTAINAINILGNATLGSGYNPKQNTFIAVDSNNAVNYPVMDTGCSVTWYNSNSINTNPSLTGALISATGNDATALTQRALVTTESARIYNGSQNHIVITDATNTYGLNIDSSNNLRLSLSAGGANFKVNPPLQAASGLIRAFPAQITASTYVVISTDTHLVANFAGTVTLTLPTASVSLGRELTIRTVTNNTVVSASSNVAPRAGGANGTAILSATAGQWAYLISDGTQWQIQMGS